MYALVGDSLAGLFSNWPPRELQQEAEVGKKVRVRGGHSIPNTLTTGCGRGSMGCGVSVAIPYLYVQTEQWIAFPVCSVPFSLSGVNMRNTEFFKKIDLITFSFSSVD